MGQKEFIIMTQTYLIRHRSPYYLRNVLPINLSVFLMKISNILQKEIRYDIPTTWVFS